MTAPDKNTATFKGEIINLAGEINRSNFSYETLTNLINKSLAKSGHDKLAIKHQTVKTWFSQSACRKGNIPRNTHVANALLDALGELGANVTRRRKIIILGFGGYTRQKTTVTVKEKHCSTSTQAIISEMMFIQQTAREQKAIFAILSTKDGVKHVALSKLDLSELPNIMFIMTKEGLLKDPPKTLPELIKLIS